MSYVNAPGTKLVATNCICCGRPLLDAESVEMGIGPVCRKRHGYNAEVGDEARTQANKLVHRAAALSSQRGALAEVLAITEEIEALGFDRLAAKIRDHWTTVKLTDTDNGTVEVRTPFDRDFVADLKRAMPWQARKWDRDAKCWIVNVSHKRELLGVLSRTFPGVWALGSKGAFLIPTSAEFQATYLAQAAK